MSNFKLFGSQDEISVIYVEEMFEETENTGIYLYDKYKISVMLSGGMLVVRNGVATCTERGDLLVFRPDEVHYARIINSGVYKFLDIYIPVDYFSGLSLDATEIMDFLEHKNGDGILRQPPGERDKLISVARDLARQVSHQNPPSLKAAGHLLNLLVMMADAYKTKEKGSIKNEVQTPVAKALDYISQNFRSKISLRDIAENSYCSATYISSSFKGYMGCTVFEYLLDYRIANAKKLLKTGKSVAETCYDCGFGDCSYFIKVFRKKEGVTPFEYKKGKADGIE